MPITLVDNPNSTKGRFAVIYDMEAWPERSLKAKGWLDARRIYIRPKTPYEIEELKESRRFMAFRYHTWEQLKADEAKYGIDADACRERFLVKELQDVALPNYEELQRINS
jgi:hypothetical protein